MIDILPVSGGWWVRPVTARSPTGLPAHRRRVTYRAGRTGPDQSSAPMRVAISASCCWYADATLVSRCPMPVSASLTPWLDNRHLSYSSLNCTAAWLSVQPSRTELLMLADSVACRGVVSPASAWHCPAIVCSVVMSSFMTPPPPTGHVPVGEHGRCGGPPAAVVVHR